MARLCGVIGLTLLLVLSVLAFVVVGVGQRIKADELAFARCYDPRREHCELVFLDLNTGLITSQPLEGAPFALEWSPDGSRLAISQRTVDSTVLTVLGTDGSSIAFRRMGFLIAWLSKDRLMLQSETGDFQVYDFTLEVFEPYTLPMIDDDYNSYYFVNVSPNLRYMAMNPMSIDVHTLLVQRIDINEILLQLDGNIIEANFDWSSDSQEVVYTMPSVVNLDIYRTNIVTGENHQITSSDDDEYKPRWSYYHNRLAFIIRNSAFEHQLAIRDENGTLNIIDLGSEIGGQIVNVDALEWSTDDDYLVVQLSFANNITNLYFIATDGTNMIRQLTYNGINFLPTWRPLP